MGLCTTIYCEMRVYINDAIVIFHVLVTILAAYYRLACAWFYYEQPLLQIVNPKISFSNLFPLCLYKLNTVYQNGWNLTCEGH